MLQSTVSLYIMMPNSHREQCLNRFIFVTQKKPRRRKQTKKQICIQLKLIESQQFSVVSFVATRSAQFTLGILLFQLKFSCASVSERERGWCRALHFPRNRFRFSFHLLILCCRFTKIETYVCNRWLLEFLLGYCGNSVTKLCLLCARDRGFQ